MGLSGCTRPLGLGKVNDRHRRAIAVERGRFKVTIRQGEHLAILRIGHIRSVLPPHSPAKRVAQPKEEQLYRDEYQRKQAPRVARRGGARDDRLAHPLDLHHGDLFAEWRVVTLDGRCRSAARRGERLATRLGPFVADLTPGDDLGDASRDRDLHVALTAWQVLGTVDRAVELAVDHVSTRIQFGKPISAFQAVQFQLADCAVAVAGLRELACFTLWRLDAAPDRALADVLALRVHALDVARMVLRACQQLHGAAGVCDEYDISVLTRHVQPALRLPWSAERTVTELSAAIARDGFEGLFSHGRTATG